MKPGKAVSYLDHPRPVGASHELISILSTVFDFPKPGFSTAKVLN